MILLNGLKNFRVTYLSIYLIIWQRNIRFPIMRAIVLLILALAVHAGPIFGQRAATILDHKDRIRITPLKILNSPYRETNLSITPDGKYLYFMSLRGGQPWTSSFMTYRSDSVFDGDIWYSRKEGGRWQRPQCMPFGINTSRGEDEPNVTPNGSTVYFQSWNYLWETNGGPYYKATRKGSTWGKPEGLGGGISEFFNIVPATDGMTVSPDERRFIVAAGPDYDVNMDIFISNRNRFGWTYCRRLGISTPGNERSVFLAADGKTLYFASNGYKGFGGLDIYKTTLNPDGSYGEIINIGEPFNTPADDYGFILTANGKEAYFIRNGDIHFADLTEADERIKPTMPKIEHVVSGTVRDSLNWKGIQADILVLDARTKLPIAKVQTSTTGKYTFTLPNKEANYDEVVIAKGYTKKRRRIKLFPQAYAQNIKANFLLSKDQPKPETPPLVASAPTKPTPEKTPAPVKPAPDTKPEPKPEPVTPIAKAEPSSPKIETPLPTAPKEVKQMPPPEDPYSFDGVAQNNLILLLDVSASMQQPDRLPLLKEAFIRMLSHMRPEDQISIITYASDVRVLVDGISAARKAEISHAIDRLGSGGGTDGKNALKKAHRQATEHFIGGGNNRIILATDGYFDVEELYNVAGRISDDRINLTVFTFGKHPANRQRALEKLAEVGKGNYANIKPYNVDKALLKEAKAVRKP